MRLPEFTSLKLTEASKQSFLLARTTSTVQGRFRQSWVVEVEFSPKHFLFPGHKSFVRFWCLSVWQGFTHCVIRSFFFCCLWLTVSFWRWLKVLGSKFDKKKDSIEEKLPNLTNRANRIDNWWVVFGTNSLFNRWPLSIGLGEGPVSFTLMPPKQVHRAESDWLLAALMLREVFWEEFFNLASGSIFGGRKLAQLKICDADATG